MHDMSGTDGVCVCARLCVFMCVRVGGKEVVGAVVIE